MKGVKQAYLRCSVVVRKEGDQYVSWCPELDVSSCGSSVEEARLNLKNAIDCFLETYSELGELKQLFLERGIKLFAPEEEYTPVYLSEAHIGVPAIV